MNVSKCTRYKPMTQPTYYVVKIRDKVNKLVKKFEININVKLKKKNNEDSTKTATSEDFETNLVFQLFEKDESVS